MGEAAAPALTDGGAFVSAMEPCERCHHIGPVIWDDEQGDLCPECLAHFETQRAKDLEEKEREADRLSCNCQD